MPACQTGCVSGMCVCECSGHLWFYTMLSDQSARLLPAGHRTGCVRAAALLGHVWTIQHGCHRSIPGVCSRWLMASHWSPEACDPEKCQDLDCISNKWCFQWIMDDARWDTFIDTVMFCFFGSKKKSRTWDSTQYCSVSKQNLNLKHNKRNQVIVNEIKEQRRITTEIPQISLLCPWEFFCILWACVWERDKEAVKCNTSLNKKR